MVTWWSMCVSLTAFLYSLDMVGSNMNMIRYAACLMLIVSASTSMVCNLALLHRLAAAVRIAATRVQLLAIRDSSNANKEEAQKARNDMLLNVFKDKQNKNKR